MINYTRPFVNNEPSENDTIVWMFLDRNIYRFSTTFEKKSEGLNKSLKVQKKEKRKTEIEKDKKKKFQKNPSERKHVSNKVKKIN